MFNFFEHPWMLVVTAAIVFFTILVLETIFPEKRLRWLMIIPALLTPTAFGLDYFIETDREKISTVTAIAAKAVENGDPNLIETIIADNYEDSCHSSKNDLMSSLRMLLPSPTIQKNIRKTTFKDLQPQKATLIFTVRILFNIQSPLYKSSKPQILTEWQADLQKQPDGRWLINRIEPLKIDFQPTNYIDISPLLFRHYFSPAI